MWVQTLAQPFLNHIKMDNLALLGLFPHLSMGKLKTSLKIMLCKFNEFKSKASGIICGTERGLITAGYNF